MTRIAVLGVGLIGGSIGLAAGERLEDATVTGWDPDPRALERALERGAIDERCGSLAEARRRAPRSASYARRWAASPDGARARSRPAATAW